MRRELSLKDRQGIVQSLWTAVNAGGASLRDVPRIVRAVIETGAWAEREVDGKIVRHDRFIDFITIMPRAGCGWPKEKVEALIKDDSATLKLWREAITLPPGTNQHTMVHDNVMHQEKAAQGNSKAYTLDRLKREAPDLFERVCANELSANAAAIEAGFRKKLTALDRLNRAWDAASDDERAAFMRGKGLIEG